MSKLHILMGIPHKGYYRMSPGTKAWTGFSGLLWDLTLLIPEGWPDNSPTFKRWVRGFRGA